MDIFSLDAFSVFVQVIFVDLVLAADNAIIVAMVASRVPPEIRQKVIFMGIAAAVVMRIGFSLIAIQLLAVPGLKLIGGLLLIWVCWKLWQEIRKSKNEDEHEFANQNSTELTSTRSAIFQIVIADLSMSIDNVLAIAGLSRDYPIILVFGLVLSVAFMIFAATLISKVVEKYPLVNYIGLIIIFYVGLQMIYEGTLELSSHPAFAVLNTPVFG